MSSKLREALNQLLGLIDNEILVFSNGLDPSEVSNAQYQIDKADEALAEPVRNCDVGTAEEQLDRYGLFCQNKCPVCENRHSCHICGERYRMKCMVAWSQMPYEEEDAK